MKKRMMTMAVVGALGASAFAGDPGGLQGFVCARFDGENASGVIEQNVCDVTTTPDFYQAHFGSRQTYCVVFYMWMERKIINRFNWYYDRAFVTFKVEDKTLVSQNDNCADCSYTPTESGWYRVEIRVSTGNYSGGVKSGNAGNGIKWRTYDGETSTDYKRLDSAEFLALTRTGLLSLYKVASNYATQPFIVSSSIRANDSTVLDVDYIVLSPRPTVNVRALAFEDGERSFWKVVRPETFVKDVDGNETAQNIGDGIAANVEHKLAWKVSADWKTDLAKVKFEVLTSEMGQLPMKKITIPATAKNPAMTVAYNTQSDTDIFNALLWYYADGVDDLVNKDGYVDATYGYANQVDTTPHRFVNRTTLNNRMEPLRYVLNKMGWEPLEGGNLLNYVRKSTRKDLWYNSGTQNAAILKSTKPKNLYLGEKAYCVIDVSAGPNAEKYPVSYLDTEPVNGWSDEYKNTKILLRRVEACRFMMQNAKEVTLTKPYYMGVFTVTQKQYEQVMGSNPTQSDHQGPMRPVEISWNAIRGDSTIYNWPVVTTVDPTTFVGKLQAKTGLKFDLPTEAQWENACCAETSTKYNNGGNDGGGYVGDVGGVGNKDMNLLGRCWTPISVPVGLFLPNQYGLYDMHGNVGQWMLDLDGAWSNDPSVDFVGCSDGDNRVFRGYYRSGVNLLFASSFVRHGNSPFQSYNSDYGYNRLYTHLSFRIARTVVE